ncbi:MAG: hypothetical protein Q7J47_17620 [Azoarcus sp.]|nr:hypothetical protein [Azoarcus sp.]
MRTTASGTPAHAATTPSNTPYPFMVQLCLDRARRDLRRASADMNLDPHAEGVIYALWYTSAISDEDRSAILNERSFLFKRAVERFAGRGAA